MASNPPHKPFSLREGVWSLAYAVTGSSPQAALVQTVFDKAAADGGHARLFRDWWQQKTLARLPPEAVVQPWVAHLHQQIAEQLSQWRLLGDQPLLLACTGCGRVYLSEPPRFARSCGRCKPSQPTAKPSPAGSRVMYSTGLYPAGPAGPQQGQSILCAHPDCLTLFLAPTGQQRYCPTHQKDRKHAARTRQQTHEPKYRRVRFYPTAPQPLQITLTASDGTPQRLEIPLSGHHARDETELLQLLQLLNQGFLTHAWTS